MTAARTALLQMLASRLLALLATVVGFAVLGRLLKPEDFGHFAIAAAAFYMLKNLANFGLRQYMIRSDREIDPAALASATGLSFTIAAVSCFLFIGAGTLLSGEVIPEPVANALVPLGIALLAGPLILGVEVQLQRALDFRVFARTM